MSLLVVGALLFESGCSASNKKVQLSTPTIVWATPSAITYGTALSSAQLNATSTTAGTFSYSPAAGTVLASGSQTLTVSFVPSDTTKYTTARATVTIKVNQATPTITWATPASIAYGTALNAAQLNAMSTIAGIFSYLPADGTMLDIGTHILTANFIPVDTVNYTNSSATVNLTVDKGKPIITWNTPAEITFGTGLSSAQLNATANVPGSFSYLPAARAILGVGTQTLTTTFTPTDTTEYNTTTATTELSITLPSTPSQPTMPTTVCAAPTAMDVSSMTARVVGAGTAASCTADTLQNAVSNGGYITFNCGSGNTTIPITSSIEVTASPTVIDGGGTITLDGGGVARIVEIQGFVASTSFRNLTFINGYGGESPDGGPTGYISTDFFNASGGAIRGNYLNTIEVINSVFENNMALFGSGGAIFANSGNVLNLTGSVFSGNKGGYGSAIFGMAAGLNVNNSIFTNNGIAETSDDASTWYPIYGGAINVDGTGNAGTFALCGSDFEGNVSPASGGALSLWFYAPDVVTIDRSTFKNNTVWASPNPTETGLATGGAANIGMGYSNTEGVVGSMLVKNSTFIENTAEGSKGIAGGLALFSDGGSTAAYNNTFYENTGATGADMSFGGWSSPDWTNPTPYIYLTNDTFAYGSGSTTSLSLSGYNYIINDSAFLENGAAVCNFVGTGSNNLQYAASGSTTSCTSGSALTLNPQLSAPANNGGPTLTMLPASTSPLIGAGSNCESTDQRGVARTSSACTIGAVEVK